MLSKNDENNKVVLATLALMLLSLSVASSIAISAPYSASAQGVTGQGGGYATNATMTGAGNATNATMTVEELTPAQAQAAQEGSRQ